ncbi:LamG domain-containing protein [Tautonia sp. JC769]|uniref:LamG domain-containing protein n=1 Tax=Tautonia sp. JC769 TaxID=3232135 RepID=UPI0034594031
MKKPPPSTESRREFIVQSAAGLLGASAVGGTTGTAEGAIPRTALDSGAIPPHRPLDLPGLHAYAEKSIAAGDPIRFRVSSTVPFELSICRLGPDIDDRSGDEVLEVAGDFPASPQPIHPGSYVHIERHLPPGEAIDSLALECWVRPWPTARQQGLITQHDAPGSCGLGLLIDEQGRAAFYLGDGDVWRADRLLTGPALEPKQWHHVVGTWDGRRQALWVNGRQVAERAIEGPVRPGGAPLRLGAIGSDGMADAFLEGDLAGPTIHRAPPDARSIRERFDRRSTTAPDPATVYAHWPLDEENGDRVADWSGQARDGRIINHGTWMVGGPRFDGSAIPRFGAYNPDRDPARGHGLRLASDDLYDCRWSVTHEAVIPETARPGLYVGRFRFELDGEAHQYDVTFLVRRAASSPPAPILVLCSTSTWLAYGGTPFAKNVSGPQSWGTGGLANSVERAPAYCFYRDHHAGQPTYQLGMNMPWPVAGPDVLYSPPEVGYSHLMRGERFTHVWLDEQGYSYDLVTDLDLHRNPEMLRDYRVVVLNGHSEYWSIPAFEGVDRFLTEGGGAIVLSGNTMFWRVSFSDDGSVVECRKYDPSIGGRTDAPIGELWHSHDRKRGSLMRECGYPAWEVIGLECLGWWGTGQGNFGVYRADATDHPLFHEPEPVGLEPGETFGHAPGGGEPRAVGHEADVRLATLLEMTHRPIPEGAEIPEEPPGITTLAKGIREPANGMSLDYFGRRSEPIDGTSAEVIYWERPQGGKVFHAGAIAAGWALSVDPRWGALMRNVLARLGVEPSQQQGGPSRT